MDGGKKLDRAKIEEAFRIMGHYLLERNALGEIAIYGGSAILFQFERRLEADGDRIFVGVYPSPERVGLRVVAAKPTYILAMKLNALERSTADDRDFEDAVNLGVACGVTTAGALRAVFRKFFPDQELPAAADLRLNELARAIASRPHP
jgi:hypothetical protein